MGTVYRRGNSKNWWIQYYRNGKVYRESTGSPRKMVAQKLLAQREGEIVKGKLPGIHYDKTTFRQLADDLINDYLINQKKSLKRVKQSIGRLERFFENFNVPQITTPRIREYIGLRMEEGMSNSTINRELAALKRMLNLGMNQTPPVVDHLPHIPMLKENNAREGFFEHEDFLALRKVLPEYLKGFVTFAYNSGWRFAEITGMKWNQVDLERRTARLNAKDSKNSQGRIFYLNDELMKVFQDQLERRKRIRVITPYVFPNVTGDGRIKDIRGSWKAACKEAGIGKRLFHDFRRTAIRNMIRAGIPERVAMMISGHRTRSVFDRYNIVSESDLVEASQKQDVYNRDISNKHILSTVDKD